jgi:hypothetical protein
VAHLVQAGVELRTVMRVSGHKSFKMEIAYGAAKNKSESAAPHGPHFRHSTNEG